MKLGRKDYENLLGFYTQLTKYLKSEEEDDREAEALTKLRNELAKRVPIISLDTEQASIIYQEFHEDFASDSLDDIRLRIFKTLLVPYGRDPRIQEIWDFFMTCAIDQAQEKILCLHVAKQTEVAVGVDKITIIASNGHLLEKLLANALPSDVKIERC